MKNNCEVIDFSKPKKYKDKDWLAMEEKQKMCKGKIKKWRSAQGGDFVEVKNGALHIGGYPVIKNDKGFWGCDYQTETKSGQTKNCATSSFISDMTEFFGNFDVIKRSNNKKIRITKKNAHK